MATYEAGTRSRLDYVRTVTALLRRIRLAHPTACLYEAPEFEWFWARPRSTDALEQLFWFDDDGEPVAAAIFTDWGDGSSLLFNSVVVIPIVLPDASTEWALEVLARGLEHAAVNGINEVELEVEIDDTVTREMLTSRGFEVGEDGLVGCWLDLENRPPVSDLADGYRLHSRDQLLEQPHHLEQPTGAEFETRLAQASSYRQDLDLVVLDENGEWAGHALFWFDPVTKIGVVEPVRTSDDHQRKGLSRHLLTTGLERLADLGAERVSIGYEPGNPASGHLYRSLGFEPDWRSVMMRGSTGG